MPMRAAKYDQMNDEAAVSRLPAVRGCCLYCKTPLVDGKVAGHPVRRCTFDRCIYLKSGMFYAESARWGNAEPPSKESN